MKSQLGSELAANQTNAQQIENQLTIVKEEKEEINTNITQLENDLALERKNNIAMEDRVETMKGEIAQLREERNNMSYEFKNTQGDLAATQTFTQSIQSQYDKKDEEHKVTSLLLVITNTTIPFQ